MRFLVVARANVLGQVAGSILFQVIGQAITRTVILQRHGVPAAATISLTLAERLIVLAILATIFGFGATTLLQAIVPEFDQHQAESIRLLIAAAIAIAVALVVGMPKLLRSIINQIVGSLNIPYLGLGVIWSLLSTTLMVAAYVVVIRALAPDAPVGELIAASAIVMFAASLPLSFSGWGVRELSAVFVFGLIGVDSGAALASAILIGLTSLAALALSVPFALISGPARRRAEAPASAGDVITAATAPSLITILSTAVPLVAAACVYFQVRLPVGGAGLNINLADPLACLGGLLFVGRALLIDRRLPAWRVPALPWLLAAMTVVLVVGFVNGYAEYGLIGWALTNRLFGWVVVLAYLATGALAVMTSGRDGVDAVFRAFVAAAFVVCLVEIVTVVLAMAGVVPNFFGGDSRISGFSNNPNAFGFILLIAVTVCLTAPALVFGRAGRWIEAVVVATLLVGIWLAGSRAIFGTLLLSIGLLALMRHLSFPTLIRASIISAFTIIVIANVPEILAFVFTDLQKLAQIGMLSPPLPSSDVERWESIYRGLALWLEAPLFGSGLGAFIESYTRETGQALIIHNTAVWLLAEVGLVGFAVFAASFGWIAWSVRPVFGPDRVSAMPPVAFAVLFAFAVVSLVHDMMFQRAIWLILGVCLAMYGSPLPAAQGPAGDLPTRPR